MDQTAPATMPRPFRFTLRRLLVWTASVGVSLGVARAVVGHPLQYDLDAHLQLLPFLGVAFLVLLALGLLLEGQWLVPLLIVCISFGIAGLWEPPPSSRLQCHLRIKTLALAIHGYASVSGQLPASANPLPDGRFPCSWRIMILPYLGERALYDSYRFDEPWDGPNNSKLAGQMPASFRCPAETRYWGQPVEYTTPYLVVTGDGTLFPDQPAGIPYEAGSDLSRTVLLVEVPGRRVHWMSPEDVPLAELIDLLKDSGGDAALAPHRGGANVAFGDGTVMSAGDPGGPWPMLMDMQRLAESSRSRTPPWDYGNRE